MPKPHANRLLPLIAATKLLKATLLLTVAFGFHRILLSPDAAATVHQWVRDVRVDPDSRFAQGIISKLTGLPEKRMHELEIATILYACLFGTEGVGLLLRKRWAEYLTIISTTVFLPLEIIELSKPGHRSVKSVVLALNLAIVAYLIVNVVRTRPKPAPTRRAEQPASS